jgi:hypothetical protein
MKVRRSFLAALVAALLCAAALAACGGGGSSNDTPVPGNRDLSNYGYPAGDQPKSPADTVYPGP